MYLSKVAGTGVKPLPVLIHRRLETSEMRKIHLLQYDLLNSLGQKMVVLQVCNRLVLYSPNF